GRDFGSDEPGVQRVRRVEGHSNILSQYRLEKRQQNPIGVEKQCIVVERDVVCSQSDQIAQLLQAPLQRTPFEVWIHQRYGTVGAAERTSFGDFQHADGRVHTSPMRKTIRERQFERSQVQTGQYE